MTDEEQKKRIEKAVGRAAASIRAVSDILNETGATVEQASKVYAFLNGVLRAEESKAQIVLRVGTFSLDEEAANVVDAVSRAYMPQYMPDRNTPVMTTPRPVDTGGAQRPRAEGRLVGTKEVVFALDGPKRDKPHVIPADERPDDTGGIKEAGFIED